MVANYCMGQGMPEDSEGAQPTDPNLWRSVLLHFTGEREFRGELPANVVGQLEQQRFLENGRLTPKGREVARLIQDEQRWSESHQLAEAQDCYSFDMMLLLMQDPFWCWM